MPAIEQQTVQFKTDFERVKNEIRKVIVGNEPIIDGVLICLLASGHALLEGVPGLGKTLLVRTLAQAVHLKFARVQFTPDLMPADITGTNILAEDAAGQKEFQFQAGPVFANIVLADEINRATPKTQSAMLEAMQEHNVTVAGTRHGLQEPFFVLATQNPIEMEGTYPLPEAQMDRFLFKLLVSSPTFEDMSAIVDRTTGIAAPPIDAVMDGATILQMRQLAREVPISPSVREFAIKVVLGTHPDSEHAPPTIRAVRALRLQSARRAGDCNDGQNQSVTGGTVQRCSGRHSLRCPACPAPPPDFELRGRSRSHRPRHAGTSHPRQSQTRNRSKSSRLKRCYNLHNNCKTPLCR